MIDLYHVLPTAGHFGFKKTRAAIFRSYSWPGASQQIKQVLEHCSICQFCKAETTKPKGLMQTKTLFEPWHEISIDLKEPLPRSSKGNFYFGGTRHVHSMGRSLSY